MEVFKLLGRFVIENTEANKALEVTSDKAEEAADSITNLDKKMQSTSKSSGKSLQDIANESGKTVAELKSDVMKAASAYKAQGMSMSDAMKQAYADIGYVSKSTHSKTDADRKKSESSWSRLKSKVAEYKAQGMSTSQAWKTATNEMKTNTEKASGGMVNAFKKVGLAIGSYLTINALKNFGLGCIQAAADAEASASQFTQVFGDFEEQAGKSLSKVAGNAGITETRMKDSFTKIAAFAKTTGMDTESALNLSERAMVAVADSAAFYDRSLEETTESLQSFLKGNYENDAALGLSCTEVTRNAAANDLYGKSFKDLSEEQKQLTLLKMVEDANKLSGALGQAARESDTWTNVTGNLKQSWTDFKAAIGKHVLPTMVNLVKKLGNFVQTATDKVEPAVEFLSDKFKTLKDWLSKVGEYAGDKFQGTLDNLKRVFDTLKDSVGFVKDKFNEYMQSGEGAKDATNFLKDAIDGLSQVTELVTDGLSAFTDWCSEHQTLIEDMALAVGSFAAAWGLVNGAMKVWNAIGIVSAAVTTAFGTAMAFLTSPITLVTVAIGAIIAVAVLLYKHMDVIEAKFNEAAKWIKDKATDMKNAVVEKFTELKDKAVNKFNELKTDAINKANELKTNAVNKFNELKTNATNKVNELKTNATNKFNEMKNNVVNKFNDMKTKALGKFDDLKSGIKEKIDWAKEKVLEGVETLKSAFDFDWSLPKIKLPHFKVSGGKAPWGFNGEGSLPSVSVEWYKRAMETPILMNQPTIFGYNPSTGSLMGGGEAGSEVVSGTNTLMNMIRSSVQAETQASVERLERIIDLLVQFFPEALEALEAPMAFDPNGLAVAMAPAMDAQLGILAVRKGRGR